MSHDESASSMKRTVGRDVLRRHVGKRKNIEVEEWGGAMLVRQLSHAEIMSIQDAAKSLRSDGIRGEVATRFTFDLVRFSWIDEDGKAVLGEEDYQEWIDQPNSIVDYIMKELVSFNNLDADAVKRVDKSFLVTQNGASGTS